MQSKGRIILQSLIALLLAAPSVQAATSDEEKMRAVEEMFSSPYTEEMYYRTDRMLLTATGSLKPIHRAPAVATVITAKDIEAIGATNLDEVLETVPGLHVSPSSVSYFTDSVYSIRGIHTGINPQVLLLINGLPVTFSYTGARPFTFRLPVADISRIEVIRGPGSAVYGADAFAGVINVFTKNAYDIDGSAFGARIGSFDFFDTWLQHKDNLANWDIAFSLEYQKSGGDQDQIIDADLQTKLDATFGTSATLAPGPLDTNFRTLDTHLELTRRNWTIRLWNWLQEDAGVGAGVTQTLTLDSGVNAEQFLTDITYQNDGLVRNFDLSLRLSYLYLTVDSDLELFPPGAKLPIDSEGNINFKESSGVVTFPDGVLGNPSQDEQHSSVDFTTFYSGFRSHFLRFGAGLKYMEIKTEETKNFGAGVLDTSPLPTVVDGTLTNVTNTPFIFMQNQSRKVWYMSLQDEWAFAKDWELTAGIRYDDYSDFGNTINPRVALVWEPRLDLTTKLLYGQAFRAPSFTELFAQNNPANQGNPNLDPETIETYEMAFDYQPTANLHAILNIFTYNIEDLIEIVTDPGKSTSTAQNVKNQEGHGFEVEADWQVTETFQLRGNFAYQRSKDKDTKELVPDAPGKQLYINPHWSFLPNWSLDAQFYWIGDRKRASTDTRPEIDDYTSVNLVLRRKNLAKHWGVALAVQNLFNEDIREPSSTAIPNDFPMASRSIYGEIRYHF